MSDYRDKKGKLVEAGDVLKVFHFIAAKRRQRMFMYKVAAIKNNKLVAIDVPELALKGFEQAHSCRMELLGDYEIVQDGRYKP